MKPSWLTISEHSDFSIHNLPFGVFSRTHALPVAGVAIGDYIIDLAQAYDKGVFPEYPLKENVFRKPFLNDFISLGRTFSGYVRIVLQQSLQDPDSLLKKLANSLIVRQSDVQLHIPLKVGNYTDFYSSQEHATNVGKLFRPDDPLFPNWKHMPVAYHGRASSIVVSGTAIQRPSGQISKDAAGAPTFAPTRSLDYELELAFVVGKDSQLGRPVPIDLAEEHIFGALLFNDWSARDIQRWEYQPLGPFTSKNFASSISPWIVTMEALEPFRTEPPVQSPMPLPYLIHSGRKGFDLHLSVAIKPSGDQEYRVSQTNSDHLYWNISQQVAHHTITGCNLNVGDLLATGTISGPEHHSAGCLLEATAGGKEPIYLSDKVVRRFLEDGDEVIIRGYGQKGDIRVGFGELKGIIRD
ncbi:fumarylacetoacetase [Dyadobacter pollutisoli]|uniref:fumarylacetoacetase n=1 Tax=Dyadobacter pollutisoli TaxID=2910158 RepID=A0A9E8NCL6_9BACT|nr:fumarylacetoacetase [Dyadobacter pollutisoli]WAC13538.1 fumarylacetoacetase [Dyadobacter pollutisoli]